MKVINLGLVSYQKARELQLKLHQDILSGHSECTLLACSHYPVVTLGRQGGPQDLLGWKGETVSIERGGKATYHGPGQIILYPIINLKLYQQNLGGHLRALERTVIDCLLPFGLKARGNPNNAGVWIESEGSEKKIASIGIAVRRWVSFHGMAFNFQRATSEFNQILSCGHQGPVMTSLEDALIELPPREEVESKLIEGYLNLMKNYRT